MKRARSYHAQVAAALICTTMSVMPPAFADTARGALDSIVSLFSSNRNINQLSAELNRRIDFPAIAQLSFEPGEWQSFSPAQQRDITASLEQLIQHRYYKRWQRLFKKHQLIVDDQADSGGYTYVRSHIMDGKDREDVIWRLSHKSGMFKVTDLNVDGKDMVARLKDKTTTQLHKKGATKFVAWLKEEAVDHADQDEDSVETSSRSHKTM